MWKEHGKRSDLNGLGTCPKERTFYVHLGTEE